MQELAVEKDKNVTGNGAENNTELDPVMEDEVYVFPTSFAQQRLWFLEQFDPGGFVYTIPAAFRVQGILDTVVLEQAVHSLVERHESLRTTFGLVDDHPTQIIHPEGTVDLVTVDLAHGPSTSRERAVEQFVAGEVKKPFNLDEGPLFRMALGRLGPVDAVLVITMHHIISDGWSMGILMQEMVTLYQTIAAGQPSSLPDLPLQYADYAEWQHEWLQGEALESQLAYWRQQLGDQPPILELPTDRSRPAVQSSRGDRFALRLPDRLRPALLELARAENVTLFMVLLSAFQTLLYRYSGQTDISVGTPIANRNHKDTESIIGFFVNTLVLRTKLDGNPSFRDLLGRVRECSLGAYAHQDLPFEKLVEELNPERDTSHTPLFQAMFVLQNTPNEVTLPTQGLQFSALSSDKHSSPFDLTLSMKEDAKGLSASLEYSTDLFDAATIEHMAIHFVSLLEAIIKDPDRSIGAFSLLTASEHEQMVAAWNDTAADWPEGVCIHRMFEAQVARTPDAVAVVEGSRQLTYAALNARVNRLARYLNDLGVAPEVKVGISLERSLDMIVGLLAILKAGGAYVPLDPNYPDERLIFMMQDSGLTVLLTQSSLRDRLHQHHGPVVCVDDDWPKIKTYGAENLVIDHSARSMAYLIYTSGSTGVPKGVMVEHGTVVNHNMATARLFDLSPADRVLQFATLNFDTAVEEIFPTLISGAALVLRGNERLISGAELMALVEEQRLSVVDLPTAYWHELVAELALRDQSRLPDSLRLVILGGDKASAERYAVWNRHGGDAVDLLNTYGPTEGTIIATAQWLNSGGIAGANLEELSIGRPIDNVKAYVLDANLRPVPVGVHGELYIGGACVTRGYLNQPAATAEKFLPDPFARLPGERVYRTGDVVRFRPNGEIEFVGRADNQVKIRGFRVEPGEVERALSQHPAVEDLFIHVLDDGGVGKRLVAYVVANRDPALGSQALRAFLREELPDYMVPSAFVLLEALPLTVNAKVDRAALPLPKTDRSDFEDAYVAPSGEVEETLAAIFAQVLRLENVGVNDNFFELGGDSILTIQIVARANRAGLHIAPRQIFQHQTIAELAAVVQKQPVILADQGAIGGPVPMTPIQHWFFEQDVPDRHHWNQTLYFEVEEELEPEALQRTVEQLVAHHDALRLRFHRTDEHCWRQENGTDEAEIPFTLVELSHLAVEERSAAALEKINQLQRCLDLASGPLLRIAYVRMGNSMPDRLMLTVHHLAVDGISWRILLEDLQTVYAQIVKNEAISLPPKSTSFKQWAERLAAYAKTDELSEELDGWLGKPWFNGTPLPMDRPATKDANVAASERHISTLLTQEETYSLLQEVPEAYHTQINDALLTALAQTLQTWTGAASQLVDLEGHGREDLFDDVDLSRTVGWFTTVYPVLLEVVSTEDPGADLKSVKESLRAIPNHGIGYGLLRYMNDNAQNQSALHALPAAEISFNYLGQLDNAVSADSGFRPAQDGRIERHSRLFPRSYLIEVSGKVVGDRLQMTWTYSDAVHDKTTMQRLADTYMAKLRQLVDHCLAPDAGGFTVSDFGLANVDQNELDNLLAKYSGK